MVSGSLALLYFLLGFHWGRQGSRPDRGQSPVEWGDFLLQAWLDGPEGGTYGQKISPFYRTLSPIGAVALPPPMKTKEKVEQGKGTADHLMPLGFFLFLSAGKPNSPSPVRSSLSRAVQHS